MKNNTGKTHHLFLAWLEEVLDEDEASTVNSLDADTDSPDDDDAVSAGSRRRCRNDGAMMDWQ